MWIGFVCSFVRSWAKSGKSRGILIEMRPWRAKKGRKGRRFSFFFVLPPLFWSSNAEASKGMRMHLLSKKKAELCNRHLNLCLESFPKPTHRSLLTYLPFRTPKPPHNSSRAPSPAAVAFTTSGNPKASKLSLQSNDSALPTSPPL